jgi:hypothetical protein
MVAAMTPTADLERAAKAATPGPRHIDRIDCDDGEIVYAIRTHESVSVAYVEEEGDDNARQDAAFAEACDPTTILSLLADLAEARRLAVAMYDAASDDDWTGATDTDAATIERFRAALAGREG